MTPIAGAPASSLASSAPAWLLAIIVALTFFSKTILNLTLPRVAVEEPRSGPLVRQIHAEGLISATQVTELYPDSRARVYRVSAAKGQVVRAGQVLVVLGCDDLQEELLAACPHHTDRRQRPGDGIPPAGLAFSCWRRRGVLGTEADPILPTAGSKRGRGA